MKTYLSFNCLNLYFFVNSSLSGILGKPMTENADIYDLSFVTQCIQPRIYFF